MTEKTDWILLRKTAKRTDAYPLNGLRGQRVWRWSADGVSAIAPTEAQARLLINVLEESEAA